MSKEIHRSDVDKPNWHDVIYQAFKIGADCADKSVSNCIPFPLASFIYNFAFTDPAVKRRDDWMESLDNRISELKLRIDDIEQRIIESDNAMSALFCISSLVLNTTSSIKLSAFQNIIINASLYPEYEEYKIQMFLSIINDFTEWHLIVLKYLADPKKALKEKGMEYNPNEELFCNSFRPFYLLYPEMKKEENLLSVIIDDLFNKGLSQCNKDFLHSQYLPSDPTKASHPFYNYTTELGNELLKFINLPKDEKP